MDIAELTGNPYLVMEILRHSDLKVGQRYVHVRDEAARAAVGKVAGVLTAALAEVVTG